MPNTLVHLGVQGIAGRAVSSSADLRVIYFSCVLPDLPWIAQRAAWAIAPGIDRIALATWCGVQGSLLFCLLLSAAIAVLTLRPWQVFAWLAAGSLLHLLLDMVQIKWAHGAILFAPFDWQPRSFELLWPEHPVFYVLLGISALFVAATWSGMDESPLFRRPSPRRWLAVISLAALYVFGPALFVESMSRADVYFSATLADREHRTGKIAWFDRASLLRDDAGHPVIEIYTGESVQLENLAVRDEGLISVKGRFTGPQSLAVESYHVHHDGVRIAASLAGLLVVAAVCARLLLNWRTRRR